MIELRNKAANELERIVDRSCIGWSWWTSIFISFAIGYFSSRIYLWMSKGYPVVSEAEKLEILMR